MKPYQQIPIVECGEPLQPIVDTAFALVQPHPYAKLGAPYGDKSPFYLREGVLQALRVAQTLLQQQCPRWRLQVFDAYRPIAVQQFMVDYTFQVVTRSRGWQPDALTPDQQQTVWEQVYQFWAVPSDDPAIPPPHSTGGAIDLTLVDGHNRTVDMGSAIDEISPRSFPEHFAASDQPLAQQWHQQRQLLRSVMVAAGFRQHPNEWWHFCLGDQMWAWLMRQENPANPVVARYGAIAEPI